MLGFSPYKITNGDLYKMSKTKFIFLISICITLSNCSAFYYGYTKGEWQNLSPSTQAEVKENYKRVVDSKDQLQNEKSIDARNDSFEDYVKRKAQH